jgi:proteasome lid subunit RPN8/RPN11
VTNGREEREVRLPPALRARILQHAREQAPFECCGLLLGRHAIVSDIVEARNVLRSTVRYRIDPRDHFAAIRRARATQVEVMGAYHSHPRSVAVPSSSDLAEAWGAFVYLIASPTAGAPASQLRAWRLENGNFVELGLVT